MLSLFKYILFILAVISFFAFTANAGPPIKNNPQTVFQCVEAGIRDGITVGEFEQTRTLAGIEHALPPLRDFLIHVPSGKGVIDFGAGKGVSVASAFLGNKAIPPWAESSTLHRMYEPDLPLYAHLKLLGITATPKNELVVPSVDPLGRYQILAGRFFEDIPNSEIQHAFPEGIAGGWSHVGVLEYTPTPDRALQKIHEVYPVGGKLFQDDGIDRAFQRSTGEIISYEEYVKECGGFKVSHVADPQEKSSIMTLVLEKTDQQFKRIPVEIVAQNGEKPPGSYFRMIDHPLSDAEKYALEMKFLRDQSLDMGSKVAIHTRQKPFIDEQTLSRHLALPASERKALADHYEKVFQGFQPRTVEQAYPGSYAAMFSYRALLGFPEDAVRFYDSHPQLVSTKTDFDFVFHAFRDLLAGQKDSPALQKLSLKLKEAQSLTVGGGKLPEAGGNTHLLLILRELMGETRNSGYFPSKGHFEDWANARRDPSIHMTESQASTANFYAAYSFKYSIDCLLEAWKHFPDAAAWMKAQGLGKLSR